MSPTKPNTLNFPHEEGLPIPFEQIFKVVFAFSNCLKTIDTPFQFRLGVCFSSENAIQEAGFIEFFENNNSINTILRILISEDAPTTYRFKCTHRNTSHNFETKDFRSAVRHVAKILSSKS